VEWVSYAAWMKARLEKRSRRGTKIRKSVEAALVYVGLWK